MRTANIAIAFSTWYRQHNDQIKQFLGVIPERLQTLHIKKRNIRINFYRLFLIILTHFNAVFHFHSPRKCQKTFGGKPLGGWKYWAIALKWVNNWASVIYWKYHSNLRVMTLYWKCFEKWDSWQFLYSQLVLELLKLLILIMLICYAKMYELKYVFKYFG